jgi:hypothetical protein
MENWEKLNVELRYYFSDKLIHVNVDRPLENVIEKMKFIMEKGIC